MTLQVLVSTMHQKDHSILEKMNIQTDAIIINQCDENKFEEFEYKGHKIKFLSFNERGVGLSRNNALMRATADICLFADDDVVYIDGYEKIILNAFEKNKKIDMIVFNVPSVDKKTANYIIKKQHKLNFFNGLRYGTCRFAVRREIILEKNIFYSLLFGGGAKYSAGEDSLFMSDCIKKRLNILANPEVIGHVSYLTSTWFKGYTQKYFFDKGVLFACLSPMWAKLFCLRFIILKKKKEILKQNIGLLQVYKWMNDGIKSIKR